MSRGLIVAAVLVALGGYAFAAQVPPGGVVRTPDPVNGPVVVQNLGDVPIDVSVVNGEVVVEVDNQGGNSVRVSRLGTGSEPHVRVEIGQNADGANVTTYGDDIDVDVSGGANNVGVIQEGDDCDVNLNGSDGSSVTQYGSNNEIQGAGADNTTSFQGGSNNKTTLVGGSDNSNINTGSGSDNEVNVEGKNNDISVGSEDVTDINNTDPTKPSRLTVGGSKPQIIR
jgi:hypothetical protein